VKFLNINPNIDTERRATSEFFSDTLVDDL